MRLCDNCGTMTGGRSCQRCGKPFPPPVPGEVGREQVRSDPPDRVVHGAPPRSAWEPTYEQREGLRYRGGTEMSFPPMQDRIAIGATVLAVLSIVLAFFGGAPGLVLGIIAVSMGRRADKQGLRRAEQALELAYVGIFLSVINLAMWIVVFGFL